MKCDFLQTRILSVFNFLKRVGFAFLLLGVQVLAHAQPPDTLWTRRYGNEFYDLAHSVAQTPDGGFVIAGETWDADTFETRNADAYVVKIDSLGNEQWSRRWGGEFSDQINKILVLEDGYLAAGAYRGYPPSPGHQVDGWILRLDVDGDTLWTRRYDYVENGFSFFNDLIQVENGHYVAVGWASPPQTFDNLWMAKITQDGEVIWSHTFGGAGIENAWAAAQAQDGGYVACGNTSSFGVGGFDMWLIKVSQNGDSLWSRTWRVGRSTRDCIGPGWRILFGRV